MGLPVSPVIFAQNESSTVFFDHLASKNSPVFPDYGNLTKIGSVIIKILLADDDEAG